MDQTTQTKRDGDTVTTSKNDPKGAPRRLVGGIKALLEREAPADVLTSQGELGRGV